jgi:hypothetical protein
MSNVLRFVVEFGIKTALWLLRWETIGEEDDARIWIEYYVFSFQKIFMCNLGICGTEFNIIPLPFKNKELQKTI